MVIAGGGDSAVDWALGLAEVAERIYVVHRRPKFRAAPETVARMEALAKAGKIELVVPYQLARLEAPAGKLDAVVVATLDGEVKRLEADVLLPFFGLAMDLGPIAQWGIEPRAQPYHGRSRRPAPPARPASSPSATSPPIRAS